MFRQAHGHVMSTSLQPMRFEVLAANHSVRFLTKESRIHEQIPILNVAKATKNPRPAGFEVHLED